MKNIDKYLYFKNKHLNIYKDNDDINKSKKLFDFINLQIGFLSFSKENVKFLKENKKHVLKRAYEFINKSKKFQYYNIPINFIKCTKFTYKRDGMIDLIFELKN